MFTSIFSYITFSEEEMEHLRDLCKKYSNAHMLVEGLKKSTFQINLRENPCVFWIPQMGGMTGVMLSEFNDFVKSKKEKKRVKTFRNPS